MIIDASSNPRSAGLFSFPGPKKHELNAILAEVYGAMCIHWHRNFREKHFGIGAYNEYKYKRRKAKYNKAKQNAYKHQNPLQLTGISRRNAWIYHIKATKNGAKCVMPNVRAFNFKPKNSDINMRAEFTTTSQREKDAYGVLARKILKNRLRGRNVKIKVNL